MFTYNDIVLVKPEAPAELRPRMRGWVIGIFADRAKYPYEQFPSGVVYYVEFEGGEAVAIHESMLELEPD